jgi:hypothetical protein
MFLLVYVEVKVVYVRRWESSGNHYHGYRIQLCFRHRTKISIRVSVSGAPPSSVWCMDEYVIHDICVALDGADMEAESWLPALITRSSLRRLSSTILGGRKRPS